jgi:hypothetical protein
MCQRKCLGVQESPRSESSRFPSLPLWSIAIRPTIARDQGCRFLVTRLLVIGAACLAVVLVAGIVLEAFDSDLDLWPFGAEDFTVAADSSSPTEVQPYQGCASLNPISCFVRPAGAHLIVQHRARGALVSESPSFLLAFNVAEPREQNSKAALPLGHFFVRSRLTTSSCPLLGASQLAYRFPS